MPPGCLGEPEATFLPVSIPATLLFEWVGVVFSAVLAVLALRSFLRPVLRDDRSAAHPRALLTAHGGSHLSWMTTWPGYSRWFTADGTRFVAYRVRLGVAITTSDPVCPPHRLEETVRGFADFATANGWTPCFYSLTAAVRAQGTALGWGALQVAEETVLPLGGLAFTGRKFEDIRTALNHARKQARHHRRVDQLPHGAAGKSSGRHQHQLTCANRPRTLPAVRRTACPAEPSARALK